MKLYSCTGTSSRAAHIALREAGFSPELVPVDVLTRTLRGGGDYQAINPKGYVPALVFDDGSMLTETVAILHWAAMQAPHLRPADEAARTALLERLAFLSTEVQKPFVYSFFLPDAASRDMLRQSVRQRFELIAADLDTPYLLGDTFGVADALLYVMLRWAEAAELPLPAAFTPYRARLDARESVRTALAIEEAIGGGVASAVKQEV